MRQDVSDTVRRKSLVLSSFAQRKLAAAHSQAMEATRSGHSRTLHPALTEVGEPSSSKGEHGGDMVLHKPM